MDSERAASADRCALCGRQGNGGELVRADTVRRQDAERFAKAYPDAWPGAEHVCRGCLSRERLAHVIHQLELERGELSDIEAEVARHAGEHVAIAEDLERRFNREVTLPQRVADRMAEVGGSWTFVISFLLVLAAWIALNVAMTARAFDPYPFILLNLVLSCLAALQAPIIMMSQNRQAMRDRAQAEQDFRVNLKAELEIASLHHKLDHLLHAQWGRMVELQELQLDMLNEMRDERERA